MPGAAVSLAGCERWRRLFQRQIGGVSRKHFSVRSDEQWRHHDVIVDVAYVIVSLLSTQRDVSLSHGWSAEVCRNVKARSACGRWSAGQTLP